MEPMMFFNNELRGSINIRLPKDGIIEVVNYDEVAAKLDVSWSQKTVEIHQYTKDKLVKPFPKFGQWAQVSTEKLVDYFESRCFPRTRANAAELLKKMGLKSYNPYKIVQITHGVIFDDYIWLRFEGEENLRYEDVGIREVPNHWQRGKNAIHK